MRCRKKLAVAMGTMLAGAAMGPAAWAQSAHTPEQRQTQQETGTLRQQWQQMNANGGPRVSKAEYDNYWKRQFKLADTNHDGKLSRRECEVAVKKLTGADYSQVKFNRMWKEVSHHGYITPGDDLAWHDKQFHHATSGGRELTKAEFLKAINSEGQTLASL